MANLWLENGEPARWLRVELTGDAWVLSTDVPTPLGTGRGNGSVSRPTLLVRRGSTADAQWVLLAGREANIRVNGSPMVAASRVLRDHDEILLGDAEAGSWRRCFFSMSGAATLEPFPANGDPVCWRWI